MILDVSMNVKAAPAGAAPAVTLQAIEGNALRLSLERLKLKGLVQELEQLTKELLKKHLPEIRKCLAKVNERAGELRGLVEAGAKEGLFTKPRTQVYHDIKVGLEKGKGRIEIEDEERTMKLIRKHLADRAGELIQMEEYVRKSALKGLTVAELEAIACEVEAAGDHVVVRPIDGEVEKTVKGLLSNTEE